MIMLLFINIKVKHNRRTHFININTNIFLEFNYLHRQGCVLLYEILKNKYYLGIIKGNKY